MIRTPARALPRRVVDEGSPGFAALLTALFPGLGQMYHGRWTRGVLMLAIPLVGLLAFGAVVLYVGPVASAVIRKAALFALLVIGGLFSYHVTIVGDAFAGRMGGGGVRGRHAIDYALLMAIVLGLAIAYYGAYRQAAALANVIAVVFEPSGGRTVGAGTSTSDTTAPSWSGRERLNVLLLGIDTRDDGQTSNTDTVIVLSMDPGARTAAMLSIPRDTVVDIPGVGPDKVNSAYTRAGDPTKGPELARRTVERFLGIPVHSYALLDFVAFRRTVESVGGVLVDVRRPLRDEEYPTADYGVERIEFRGGPQLMDGESALRYARSRHESNDFDRARRQQAILLGLRDRFALAGLFRLPGIVERIGPFVRTNVDPGSVVPLARVVLSIDAADIHSDVLLPCGGDEPHCELTEENGPAGYYLIPDIAKVRAVVTDLFSGQRPASAR